MSSWGGGLDGGVWTTGYCGGWGVGCCGVVVGVLGLWCCYRRGVGGWVCGAVGTWGVGVVVKACWAWE